MKDDRILAIDRSHWVTVDYNAISPDVGLVILKATSGDYSVDGTFVDNAPRVLSSGRLLATYHWDDPIENSIASADYYLKAVEPWLDNIEFLAVDIEQWWSNWAAWNAWRRGEISGSEVPVLPPARIADSGYQIASRIRQKTGKKVVIYTNAYFVLERAPKVLDWLDEFETWYAYYPYNRQQVTTTWEQLSSHFPPIEDPVFPPAWPDKYKTWDGWQFSGDKFLLPGTEDPGTGRRSALDLNFIKKSLLENEPSPPPVPSLPEEVIITANALNVRDDVYGNKITYVYNGQRIPVTAAKTDADGRVWYQLGLWAAGWWTKEA